MGICEDFEERFLSGQELYGDDFNQPEIESWFEDEREGYANLSHAESPSRSRHYYGLNKLHGFSKVPKHEIKSVLGLGSSWGWELLPIVPFAEQIIILEPSQQTRSTSLHGKPLQYVTPESSGTMVFPDGQFDLVVSLGVLHHIPNVSHVIQEAGRVLSPGGWFLLREPIVSMGDWRKPRRGLTARERGIPRRILEENIKRAEIEIVQSRLCGFPTTNRLGARVPLLGYQSCVGARIDRVLSILFAWNLHYHATNWLQKLQPGSVFIVGRKNLNK